MSLPTPKQIAAVGAAAGLSLAALAAMPVIVRHEGMPLVGYLDPVGIPTECVGHVEGAKVGRVSTPERCLNMLAADVAKFDREIRPCIRVPVSDTTRAAFISFSFNVGSRNFCNSSLNRKLNAGDVRGACAEMDRWVYAKGRRLPGLVKRRAEERAWCERGAA